MTTGAAQSSSDDRIVLEGELTIYTAAETFARLRGALQDRDLCDLDLSAISEMDSAGLQLLLWLKQTCEAQGTRFRLVAHSEAVAAVLELLQLAPRLGIVSDPLTEEQPA
ncbi:STAS domain-containing protein [Thiorhodococcus mannitoliphagus]|uniref:STAS domain-containing protein n=1 Tax=Thiorhodococcus mannitoliphagus TaxID=329406 RepID=A0A6P1DZB0_9GAMM|nr:STAS domain-containing protein [Thiorhodococcus mannitoliphagus]NEX22076.1 STAS domain-containing protein [Thiorhodococcus mannitoliphagus]